VSLRTNRDIDLDPRLLQVSQNAVLEVPLLGARVLPAPTLLLPQDWRSIVLVITKKSLLLHPEIATKEGLLTLYDAGS